MKNTKRISKEKMIFKYINLGRQSYGKEMKPELYWIAYTCTINSSRSQSKCKRQNNKTLEWIIKTLFYILGQESVF